jgi:tetratricopeptide (TPR) repeat protein
METQPIDALLSQSLQLFNVGKFADAVPGLRQVVGAQPGNAKARTLLGACLGQTGQHSEAVEQFLELSRLDPGNAMHYFNLGNAYRSCGNLTQAEGAYRKAVEINPGYGKATEALNSLTSLKDEVMSTQAVPPPPAPSVQQSPPGPSGTTPWQSQPPPPSAPQYSGGYAAPQGAPSPPVYPDLRLAPHPEGLNWGALLLTPFWAIAHGTWIGLLAFGPFLGWILTLLVPPLGFILSGPLGLAGLIVAIVLLLKGNEWGWQNRAFSSVDEFRRVQKIWAYWGLGVLIFVILLSMVTGAIIGLKVAQMQRSGTVPPFPVPGPPR